MTLKGVDVSAFQETPATWRDKAGAIAWGGVKISELSTSGPYVSPVAAADWTFLAAHGKARIGYLFGHPGTSVAATVSLFTGELAKLGLGDGDGVALDLEVTDGQPPGHVAAWAGQVLAELEHQLDRVPVLYTYLSFARAGNCAGLGGYPLWISDPSSPAGSPRIPGPWSRWAIHQHSITGSIDRDLAAYGSLAGMRGALGKKGTPVPVEQTVVWKAAGSGKSLAQLAADKKTAASTILRLTAQAGPGGKFPGPVADWLNAVFAGHVQVTAPIPADVELRLPKP
jgi:hypothetical protein